MHVDRVLPSAGVVLKDPDLGRALLDAGPHVVRVEELAVDRPRSLAPFEPPGARGDHLVEIDLGKFAELRRNLAEILDARQRQVEAHEEVPLARGEDLARRAPAVLLLEAVLEVDARAGLELREVDDHVDALGDGDAHVLAGERGREEVAVGRDLDERNARPGPVEVGQVELVEA